MTRGDPIQDLLIFGIAAYFLWLWFKDMRAGGDSETSLPGAKPCGFRLIWFACLPAVGLVVLETGGEYALGISGEQHTLMASFILSALGAAIVEEIVFRGYLFVGKKGTVVLWLSVLMFSGLFALLHPFLWQYETGDFAWWQIWEHSWQLTVDTKGWFSTFFVFVNSLWFYALRFMPFNSSRSLLPCFAAHASSNLAVFAIKAMQGFVEW